MIGQRVRRREDPRFITGNPSRSPPIANRAAWARPWPSPPSHVRPEAPQLLERAMDLFAADVGLDPAEAHHQDARAR